MKRSAMMRQLLDRPGMLILLGVADALGARIVEEAGFEAVYLSGSCTEATYGNPDVGMLTMTEMVSRAASITEAVDIPVITDAEAGYGSAINVIRTVHEFERAGVAGIHLEDQAMPIRCSHYAGTRLVSTAEMVGKIHAAVDARTDQDFIIIARTDAVVASMGLEEAIMRGRAYIEAGADIIFVILQGGPYLLDELRTVCSSLTKPVILDFAEAPKAAHSLAELDATGLKVALIPLTITFSAITAMRRAARDIKQLGMEGVKRVMQRNDSWDSVLELVRLDRIIEWSESYSEQAMASKKDSRGGV